MYQKPIRCIDCCYNHPRFCGYTKMREEGKGNTAAEDSWRCCRDFSPDKPPDRDDPDPKELGVNP